MRFHLHQHKGLTEPKEKGDTQRNVTYEHKPTMTFIGFFTSIRLEAGYIIRFPC